MIFLAGFTIYGIRRGLLQALAGLVIVIVALVGAGMIAATFSAPAAKLAAPLIEKRIEQKVDTALAEQKREVTMPEDDVDFQLEDLLDLLGLDTDVRKPLAEKAEETVRETGASLITAVVESIAQSVIYGVLYILSFLALLALLHVLFKAMGLLVKLPGLRGLNALGGGLLGRQAQFCASAGASVSETSALAMMASRVFFHMME